MIDRCAALVASSALVLALSACAPAAGSEADVDSVAQRFTDAVEAKDGAGACALLSPSAEEGLTSDGTPCEKAVLDVKTSGQPERTQVWGDEAQVRTPHDVIFLMHLTQGWRIRAAGCKPRSDRPYACDVEA